MTSPDLEALKTLAKMIQAGNEGDWNDSWRMAVIRKARECLPALEHLLAGQQEPVAWLIIHDVGHGLIEKEVVFEPYEGAIPLVIQEQP